MDVVLEDEFMQFPFGEDCVGDVEAGELPLMGPVDVESLQRPIVQLTTDLELQGTQGMSDAFDAVAQRVRVVVERIDAPLVPYMRVRVEFDSVNHWISQGRVGTLVVDLGPERICAFLMHSKFHLVEQSQIVLNRSVSVNRRQSIKPFLLDLLSRLRTHKGVSLLDQLNGILVELFEVLRGVGSLPGLITHVTHVLGDVVNELLVLFGWVRVVEAKVTVASVGLGQHETESHGFAMPDVQVAVGLRGEPS